METRNAKLDFSAAEAAQDILEKFKKAAPSWPEFA